jgi:hypothetical protein
MFFERKVQFEQECIDVKIYENSVLMHILYDYFFFNGYFFFV